MKYIDKMKVVSDTFGELGNWKQFTKNRLNSNVDSVSVCFVKNKISDSKFSPQPYLRVRLTKSVADNLGWSHGTKIIPYQQQDNLFLFLLVEGQDGYKLTSEASDKGNLTVKFPFETRMPIEHDKRSRDVKFEILNKVSLVFNAKP